EWNRHDPAVLVGAPTNAAAASVLQRLAGHLNASLPSTIQACVPWRPSGNASREAFIKLADDMKIFMSPVVNWAQSAGSAQARRGECLLRCSMCSSGWAGTITLTKTYSKNNTNYFSETDTLYVGGASASNPHRFSAEWTAVGSGTYHDSTATLNWSLSA